ncbi:MAG TPA: hypothetical protein VEC96_12380, partial [Anaerolineae bacterium]|nr:hypothetical protein [Anaerolineae bacterium]
MTAEITTVIGQLNITGGNWRGDAPNQVAVREPKSAGAPGAGKGDLFVLTEVRGAKSNYKTLEQKLAEIVRDAYYLDRGSVTASLRRALQAAGDQLYQRNIQVSVEERIVAGVVALVMSGEDAFVAQIGPAALFAVLGDHVQRYPTHSVWLDEALPPRSDKRRGSPEDENESALGISAIIEPNLYHLRASPQDMLILADSGLASQLPLGEVVKAVAGRNIKTAIKNLGQIAQASDCSALALMVVEEAASTFGSFLKRNVPPPQRKSVGDSGLLSEAETAVATLVEEAPSAEAVSGGLLASPLAKTRSIFQQPTQWLGAVSKKSDQTHQVEEDEEPPISEEDSFSSSARVKAFETEEPLSKDAPYRGVREPKVMASMARGSNFEPKLRPSQPRSSPFGQIFRWLGIVLLLPVAML